MSMTPENRLDIDVEVQVDGVWLPGVLRHWRQREGQWEGWVVYLTGPGESRLDWFVAEKLRQA